MIRNHITPAEFNSLKSFTVSELHKFMEDFEEYGYGFGMMDTFRIVKQVRALMDENRVQKKKIRELKKECKRLEGCVKAEQFGRNELREINSVLQKSFSELRELKRQMM